MTEDRTASQPASARRAMIDSQLRTSGVNEPWLLSAIASVEREAFVPAAMRDAAYIDRAIPLGDGRMLAAPLVHARMLAEAAPTQQDSALLIGDAQGYLAALLRPLVGSLDVLAPGAAIEKRGKGANSLVIVDGAIEELPKTLGSHLCDGGRIVTGIVERGVTRLATGCKAAGTLSVWPLADIGIPILPEFAAPKGWTF